MAGELMVITQAFQPRGKEGGGGRGGMFPFMMVT